MKPGFNALILAAACLFPAVLLADDRLVFETGGETFFGAVNADPGANASSARPYELPFAFRGDGLARAAFNSEQFFAVILVSGPRCSITDTERQEAQAIFPTKVFVQRFGCCATPSTEVADTAAVTCLAEDNVTYENTSPDHAFMAVFAGRSRTAAEVFLHENSIAERFPGANIRRMRAALIGS